MEDGRAVTELGRAIAAIEDKGLSERAKPSPDRRLAAVRAALSARRTRYSWHKPIAAGALSGAVVAMLLLFPRTEPLRFTVGEAASQGAVGTWVAAGEARTPISFSDGSHVLLAPGARARVASVGEHGARVVLERGTLLIEVVPRRGNDWSAIAGPFEIRVTGTSFDTTWDPGSEELSVTMREGHVVVHGGCLDHDRSLFAGESLKLRCQPSPRASAPDLSDDAGAPKTPSAITATAEEAKTKSASETARPTTADARGQEAKPRAPLFLELSRRGEYQEALGAAEAAGFESLCETLSAQDLLELATAARLARRGDRGRLAYAAIRRRFPGSDAAATSAFLLGQMAFDGARAYSEAHRWFQAYLAERPSGQLAAEALGRVMEAEQRIGDAAAARATATRYLTRFPRGAHAAIARGLLSSP